LDQAVEHQRFGGGFIYTFSVLKRLVVAKMDWTEDFHQVQKRDIIHQRIISRRAP
jgi:hypothetical protein